MKKVVLAMVSVTALCLYSIALEEEVESVISQSFEEAYTKLAAEAEGKLLTCASVKEYYQILLEHDKKLRLEMAARMVPDLSSEEYIKLELEYAKARNIIRGPSIETFCKWLDEKFDDPETVRLVMHQFYFIDGRNVASYGNEDVLYWARRILREDKPGEEVLWARRYLELKGDARDIETLPYFQRDKLSARVEGTNILIGAAFVYDGWGDCIPSVTNTGPQALYVHEILRQTWESLEVESHGHDIFGQPRGKRDKSKIPPELITMVVWFDEDGNPMCNVDLAKYGLTMPEIDLPQDVKDEILRRAKGKGRATASRLAVSETASPYLPYLAILCASAALFIAYKKRKRGSSR